MSKLAKLKEWLTLREAAEYLAKGLKEDVSEADILQLAMNGRLTISVRLPVGTFARHGRLLNESEAVVVDGFPMPADESMDAIPDAIALGQRVMKLDEYSLEIDGLWDLLPRYGAERVLEIKYRELTVGGAVDLARNGPIIVIRDNSTYVLEQNKQSASAMILTSGYTSPDTELPEASLLVVRTSALDCFLRSQATTPEETPLQRRERPSQGKDRLKRRVQDEKNAGRKNFLEVVAAEEGISVSRLKQLTKDDGSQTT